MVGPIFDQSDEIRKLRHANYTQRWPTRAPNHRNIASPRPRLHTGPWIRDAGLYSYNRYKFPEQKNIEHKKSKIDSHPPLLVLLLKKQM